MNHNEQAKERVCKSLLTRIKVLDEKLIAADETKEVDLLKSYFLRQSSLINRLELVLTH